MTDWYTFTPGETGLEQDIIESAEQQHGKVKLGSDGRAEGIIRQPTKAEQKEAEDNGELDYYTQHPIRRMYFTDGTMMEYTTDSTNDPNNRDLKIVAYTPSRKAIRQMDKDAKSDDPNAAAHAQAALEQAAAATKNAATAAGRLPIEQQGADTASASQAATEKHYDNLDQIDLTKVKRGETYHLNDGRTFQVQFDESGKASLAEVKEKALSGLEPGVFGANATALKYGAVQKTLASYQQHLLEQEARGEITSSQAEKLMTAMIGQANSFMTENTGLLNTIKGIHDSEITQRGQDMNEMASRRTAALTNTQSAISHSENINQYLAPEDRHLAGPAMLGQMAMGNAQMAQAGGMMNIPHVAMPASMQGAYQFEIQGMPPIRVSAAPSAGQAPAPMPGIIDQGPGLPPVPGTPGQPPDPGTPDGQQPGILTGA